MIHRVHGYSQPDIIANFSVCVLSLIEKGLQDFAP